MHDGVTESHIVVFNTYKLQESLIIAASNLICCISCCSCMLTALGDIV